MNPRIRELAEQSGWMMSDEVEGFNIRLEKFAELIVGECIGCCEQVISDPVPESVDTWLNGIIANLKGHFGI